MKIESIFEIVKGSLLAIKYAGEPKNAFELTFEQWKDVTYLEDFFEIHREDLKNKIGEGIRVEDAVLKTLAEAGQFEDDITYHAEVGKTDRNKTLESFIFRPLHKYDRAHIRQQSKAYGSEFGRSWLRLYAIRLDPNLYVVTGGAIKLTAAMQDRWHTQNELVKLEKVSGYLKELGIEDASDYGYIDFGEV